MFAYIFIAITLLGAAVSIYIFKNTRRYLHQNLIYISESNDETEGEVKNSSFEFSNITYLWRPGKEERSQRNDRILEQLEWMRMHASAENITIHVSFQS